MGAGLVEKRERHAALLERALDKVVARLADLPEVEKVIVFGSYRQGRRDLFTDLDVLVVMRSAEGFLARTQRLYGLLGGRLGIDVDLIAYTPEEIAANMSRPFLRRVLREGEVVYERRG